MQLEEIVLALQQERLSLQNRIAELETGSREEKRFQHIRGLYYQDGDTIPFCPQCYEATQKNVHLFSVEMFDPDIEGWRCNFCRISYTAKPGEPFRVISQISAVKPIRIRHLG
jgi:hypothetical protein